MVTVPGTFSSSSTGPGGFGSSGVQIHTSYCMWNRSQLFIKDLYRTYNKLTCDSNFNAECFLTNNVLDNDCVDSSVWALRGGNKKLRCSLCIADCHLLRHWCSIFQPCDLWPRRGLEPIELCHRLWDFREEVSSPHIIIVNVTSRHFNYFLNYLKVNVEAGRISCSDHHETLDFCIREPRSHWESIRAKVGY